MKLLLAAFVLSSPAFHANAPIPRAYTCDGRDTAPPLRWTAPPRGTRSRHHYVFTLFALGRALSPSGSNATAFGAALARAHVLARAKLIGTYRR